MVLQWFSRKMGSSWDVYLFDLPWWFLTPRINACTARFRNLNSWMPWHRFLVIVWGTIQAYLGLFCYGMIFTSDILMSVASWRLTSVYQSRKLSEKILHINDILDRNHCSSLNSSRPKKSSNSFFTFVSEVFVNFNHIVLLNLEVTSLFSRKTKENHVVGIVQLKFVVC